MRNHKRTAGRCIICAGIFVIMALVLPTGFWWFTLGVVLIIIGINVCRSCVK